MHALAHKTPDTTATKAGASWLDVIGSLFRRSLSSEADILHLVETGVSRGDYLLVTSRLQLPKDAIGAETTIRNRLKQHARLNIEESERLLMIARVYAMAQEIFGSEDKAITWLHKPARYVRDKPPIAPIALAQRDSGVRLLEDKLLRTAHGMF